MKLPIRLRVRTLMAIIAFIALGFGVTFELKNHAELDRLLRRQAESNRQAAIHFRRALECKFADDRHDPYRPAERAKLLLSDRVMNFTSPGGFRSWDEEMQNHRYWGSRIYDQVQVYVLNLEAVEAKLLIHISAAR